MDLYQKVFDILMKYRLHTHGHLTVRAIIISNLALLSEKLSHLTIFSVTGNDTLPIQI